MLEIVKKSLPVLKYLKVNSIKVLKSNFLTFPIYRWMRWLKKKYFVTLWKKSAWKKWKCVTENFLQYFLKIHLRFFLYFRSSLKVIFDVQIEINPETNFINVFPEFVSFCKFVYFLSLASYSGFIWDEPTVVLLHQADSKPWEFKINCGFSLPKIFLRFDEVYSLNRNLASVPKIYFWSLQDVNLNEKQGRSENI